MVVLLLTTNSITSGTTESDGGTERLLLPVEGANTNLTDTIADAVFIMQAYMYVYRLCNFKMASGTSFHLVSSKAIEQFVLLAKTAKGQAVVELVKEALEAPGVYVFGELMDTPAIKQVLHLSCSSFHQISLL